MDGDQEDYQIPQADYLPLLLGILIVWKDKPGLVDLLRFSPNNVLNITHGYVAQICTKL